nr:EOG090X04F1 [Eurycercus lamellatus]
MNENLDLQKKIVKALNEEIGSDLKQLHKLKELYDETKTIQDSLKEKVGRHLTAAGAFLDKLRTQLEIVDKLEREHCYLLCLKNVEDISDKLQEKIQANQDLEAVEIYNNLVQFGGLLQVSQCSNLKTYVDQTVVFWFELLKEKLKKDLQDTLKLIQWPLISTNQEVLKAVPPSDVMTKFQLQFQCLWKLEIPPKLEGSCNSMDIVLSRFPPQSQAIQELIYPLLKRFSYHFSGNRPTNRRDKPEWYLRQVLQWIGDHAKFIETHVQPFYKPNDALVEFSRGLVQLAVEKLVKDSAVVLDDDVVLAHTIGEVLSFESELRTSYDYPSSQPSALLILTQPQFFTRWIALERAFAVEKMDVLLSSDRAWVSSGGDGTEVDDDVRLTECGEGFLQMVLAITDRYKILPQPGHKLQFVDLQLELLDEFRIRLLQLARQDKFQELFVSKTSPNISPILNTVSAVVNVLDDWTDLPFFVQLYSYKVQSENVERLAAEAASNESVSLPWLRTQAHSKADESSVFDGIIELLKRMQEDLLRRLVEAVMLEVKAKSQPYRLDKWASLPNPDEYIQPSLSPTGSAMLQAIAVGIQWLKDSLASTLFTESWQKLAAQVNQFLFEELILQRQFNDGGAAQLCYDIQQNLIPLFSQLTSRPESYFRE